ncbi:DUF2182 domain-containing protein [Defluviimonas sp. D31]|uniref:DUF2182 domain-containing protein n=1 Tax=Defluviimonas sp. D31 TaxID=3083253 RepID=UPI00296FC49D|nr:DUF2182 domain-containing protein [Defluviimonas sp. D31]
MRPMGRGGSSAARPDAAMLVAFERLARDGRPVLLSALGLIFAIAALWVLWGAGMGMTAWDMTRAALFPHLLRFEAETGMEMGRNLAGPAGWNLRYVALMALMWWAMMIAMMLPSALPMILIHARVVARGRARGHAMRAAPGWFAAGYLAVWLGFSVAAALLQLGLVEAGLISGMMLWSESRWLSAGLLVLAAGYQVSGLKYRCLVECRSPMEFLARHWRDGAWGAFSMGFRHGAFCLGCCWPLMLLLFVGGVMNLFWIAALALLVLVEKLAGPGVAVGRITGGLLLVWALATLAV